MSEHTENTQVSIATTVSQKAERINHLNVSVPTLQEIQTATMGEVNAAMLDMVMNTASNVAITEQEELDTDEKADEQDQDSLEPNQRKSPKAVRKVKPTRQDR